MFGLVHCNASILARQDTDPQLYFVRSLIKTWLWPIITFFGVTGNILAIIVLTKRRMIMSSTNNYLVALAIVDIAYLLLTLIVNTSLHPCFISTTFAEILFTICRPIADFSSNTSVWLTVTFTVERWVAITYPLQSRTWCTVHRARKIIISVMCAALICTSPSAFETKLVRVIEITNSSDPNEKVLFSSRIRAKATALGDSLLYHRIYFNFVTFAIVWIPLVLLIIFNAVLIVYVHRSRQSDYGVSDGIKLRRHNRGNQGEQRKTTIMLIAVVIVFTVCQIPQAISLTVQSFFHKLSRSPKVLIFNNFANCLVALNASINFLLYCCFSGRFRSTFKSSFAFLTKYCVHYIEPNWKLTTHATKHGASMDNVSFNVTYNQSNYSLHGPALNTRISNMSTDVSQKGLKQTISNASQLQPPIGTKPPPPPPQRWTSILSKFSSHGRNVESERPDLKQTLVWQSTDTGPSTPNTSVIKGSAFFSRPLPVSNVTLTGETAMVSSMNENQRRSSPTMTLTPNHISPKCQSLSMNTLNRPISKNRSADRSSKDFSMGPKRLCTSSKLPLSYHSQRSLQDAMNQTKEQIWVKRRLSSGAKEKLFDRRKSFIWREILDVTV